MENTLTNIENIELTLHELGTRCNHLEIVNLHNWYLHKLHDKSNKNSYAMIQYNEIENLLDDVRKGLREQLEKVMELMDEIGMVSDEEIELSKANMKYIFQDKSSK